MEKLQLNIKKTLLKRKVNGVVTEGYYGRVITNGTKSFNTIAEDSCTNTTVHKAEMKVAAELFLDGASKALKEGYIVDLGPLGKLVPAVSGPWKTNPDDLELSAMEGKVNYRPSADIKTVIEGAEKGWTTKKATADNTDEEDETNTPQGGGNNPDDGMLG